MISICMNDLQHVITNVWAGEQLFVRKSVVINLFFIIIIVFFHHSKIIIIVIF